MNTNGYNTLALTGTTAEQWQEMTAEQIAETLRAYCNETGAEIENVEKAAEQIFEIANSNF